MMLSLLTATLLVFSTLPQTTSLPTAPNNTSLTNTNTADDPRCALPGEDCQVEGDCCVRTHPLLLGFPPAPYLTDGREAKLTYHSTISSFFSAAARPK